MKTKDNSINDIYKDYYGEKASLMSHTYNSHKESVQPRLLRRSAAKQTYYDRHVFLKNNSYR